jgi:antirestriction protein ArdC
MHADELFEKVTAELVDAIEAGASGWQMPWRRLAPVGVARSIEGRPYRGINSWVLGMTAADRGWKSNTWSTYQAWQSHGAQVRRGERGTQVVLWKQTDRREPDVDGENEPPPGRRGLFARTFTVFAAEQVDGAGPPVTLTGTRTFGNDDVDRYFAAIDARVVIGGNTACYRPGSDTIHLPDRDSFDSADHWWSTACHEHMHWTGHHSRLARDLTGRFGDHAYGAEELTAELGTAFWSARTGLDQAARDDHARYLGDWLALLKSDTRALVAVCGHAQRALDHLDTCAAIEPAVTVTRGASA